MNNNFGYLQRILAVLGASLFSISAVSADKPVTVTFDGAGCPINVSPGTIDVSKANNDRVVWNAVKQGGGEYKDGFSIIFDPFNGGRRLSTNNKSSIKSPPVDNKIPADANIQYKYSVMGKNCPTPYDPLIRVL